MGKQWTGMWLAAALAACGPVEKSGNRGEAPAGGELPGDDGIEVADVRPDHEPTAPGRLQGRLDDDGGYQPAGQLPQGGAIAADRARLVDLQGRVLGEAAIGPDGRFSVGGLTATGEVTLVEVLAAGEPAGQVLVVPGLSVGGDAHTLPVSVETSVEASVYLRLVADGHAVDPIEVAVRVTPAMAAVCDVDGLTRAVWQAHQAFTRTLGSGAALDIAALTSARRRAWGELAVDLDTGHPEAWPNFMAAARVGLRGLGVDDETTLLAELAAGAALASHLDADACRTAGLAGAADQVARVGGPTVSPWVAGHPYAEAIQIEALARLGVAFADVEDAEDVEVAEDALIGALVGPVLTALVAGDEADEAVAHAAFQIALEARNDLEDVAGDGGEAIAQVALDLEARLELALAGLERDDLRGWLRAAAPWVACHLGGLIRIPGGHPPVEEPPVEEPPVVVDPTPPEEPPAEEPPAEEPPAEEPPAEEPPAEEPPAEEPPVHEPPALPEVIGRLVGTVTGGARPGILGGALGLLDGDGGWLAALRGCDSARLVALGPHGERRILGEGPAGNGAWHIDVLADGHGELRVVELLRGGVVIGGRVLAAAEGIDGECAPVDAESSVEARVVVALTERGVEADLCVVGRLIDGAIAFAVRGQADIDALADAIETSQLAYAQVLGAAPATLNAGCAMSETQWQALQQEAGDGLTLYSRLRAAITHATGADAEDQARATAASCGAFTGLLRERLGGATLVLAAEARARIEDAIATNAACGDGLAAELRALITATVDAGDGAALADAGAAFHAALVGEGGLLATLVADAGGLLAGLVDRLLGRSDAACADEQGRLTAALHAAAALRTADARADAVVTAYADAEASATDAGLNLFALFAAEDRHAAARLLAYAVVGRYAGPR